MKLFGSLTSPYVRKVRIVLAEKKMECEFIQEDVWSPQCTISQINPLGKVPVLVLDDSTCVHDSRVIVEYLDSRAPIHRLIPEGGRERTEVKVWEALADGLQDSAVSMLLESKRPAALRSADWLTRQAGKVDEALAYMARSLGKSPWCCGRSFSLADIATGTALGYLSFRFPENNWQKTYPNLLAHYEKLMARDSFRDTVPSA
jgi:glutathione S-transferase